MDNAAKCPHDGLCRYCHRGDGHDNGCRLDVRVPHPHVHADAEGTMVVKGTRVPVSRLFAWHKQGTSVDTLVKRYPYLGWAKVLDALSFAYDNQHLVFTSSTMRANEDISLMFDKEYATPEPAPGEATK